LECEGCSESRNVGIYCERSESRKERAVGNVRGVQKGGILGREGLSSLGVRGGVRVGKGGILREGEEGEVRVRKWGLFLWEGEELNFLREVEGSRERILVQ
jgi:hypothetical protein